MNKFSFLKLFQLLLVFRLLLILLGTATVQGASEATPAPTELVHEKGEQIGPQDDARLQDWLAHQNSSLSGLANVLTQYEGWEDQTLPFENGMINKLSFTDENHGWAIGMGADQGYVGVVLNTTDGGTNWNTVDFSIAEFEPTTLWATDSNTCYVAGRNKEVGNAGYGKIMILKTTDGGASWSVQTVPEIKGRITDVTCTSGTSGVAIGRTDAQHNHQLLIINTLDGTNWQQAVHPAEEQILPAKVTFSDINHGWTIARPITGTGTPGVYKTTDGGSNWNKVNHPILDGTFDDICFISADTGWVTGEQKINDEPVGFILQTKDGGTTWANVDLDIPVDSAGTTMSVRDLRLNTLNFLPEDVDGKYRGMLAAKNSESGNTFTVVSQITYSDDVYVIFDHTKFDDLYLSAYQIVIAGESSNNPSSAHQQNNTNLQKLDTNLQKLDTSLPEVLTLVYGKVVTGGPYKRVVMRRIDGVWLIVRTLGIFPKSASMNVGEQQQFTATGKDQNGNDYPISNPVWEVTGGGTIVPSGHRCTFTATTAGKYQISCRDSGSGISGLAGITITDDTLASVKITPSSVTMQVGDPPVTFNANGKNADGQTVTIPNPVWKANGGGTIVPSGHRCTFTAMTAGKYQISCRDSGSGISGLAGITITDDTLASVKITPSSVTMQVGDPPVTFNANGKNADGQTVTIPNPVWKANGGGTIVPSGHRCTFTAMTAGTYQISCRDSGSGISGSAGISITDTSVETATGTGTAYFANDAGTLENLAAVDDSTLPTEGKPALVFPHGFFSFDITGLTPCAHQKVNVTITLPSAVPVGTEYWKYHASEGGWIQIPMGSDDGDAVITITLEDGGLGDDDGECNGVIVDSGGPGVGVFDTGSPANPYPSVYGTHRGTITANQTITVSRLYTYPCAGTGGHSEYARIWNTTLNVTARWDGYRGDWHNISFDKTFTLAAHETYNYSIKTGSYPQIHHTSALPTANGWINCIEFTDANGKKYKDGIPAIRLFL